MSRASRILTENEMYVVLRYALISAFSKEKFLDCNNLSVEHFQQLYDFVKSLYYEHCKNREDVQK